MRILKMATLTALWVAHLAIGGVASAQNSDLELEGTFGYQRTNDSVLLTAERVCNRSTGGTSGTVNIGLFATAAASPFSQGYVIAETSLRGSAGDTAQLAAGACFTNIRFTTEWKTPPNGVYYVHFYATEYPNTANGPGEFRLLDTGTFDTLLTVGTPPPPPPPPPPPSDDHGDSTATATVISLGTTASPTRTTGVLGASGDIDAFRFTVGSEGQVTLRTESSIDTIGELRNSSGEILASGDDTGTDLDFTITTNLVSGTYYLLVGGFGGETGSYAVLSSANATVPPPNSNRAPTAAFSVAPADGAAPLAVTFDAFQSSDVDGTITTFAWDFGDGAAGATGMGASHTFSSAGTYTVRLTVTDNNGATNSATRQVTVRSSGGGSSGGGGAAGMIEVMLLLAAAVLMNSRGFLRMGARRSVPFRPSAKLSN